MMQMLPQLQTVDASAANVAINLTSINASPNSVNSGSPVKITAIFSVSSQMQPENQTEIANNASTSRMTRPC